MKRSVAVFAVATVAVAALAAAPASLAYNKDAYAYAVTHMVESKNIPKALGSYRSAISFYASADRPEMFLCSLAESGVSVRGATYAYGANYLNAAKKSPKNVSITVYQFSSNKAAISTFRAIERQAKRCTGTQADSSTDDDGVVYSWKATLQNGKVKDVSVTGVQSVFVNADYESGASDRDRKFLSDTYTLYTLVNDAVIATAFTNSSESQLTAPERKGVHQLAFNAVTAWLS